MVHRTSLKVRFYELDPYDHVNHTSYFAYFETARIEALEEIGWGLQRLKEMGIHLVVVEIAARFEVPAMAGDVLTVETELVEARRASSVWRQRMERRDDTISVATVRAAAIDRSGRPCRVPDGMAEAMEKLRA